MIKKTITYTDYFDQERTEDFYFNLEQSEIIELEMGITGGLEYYMQRITEEKNTDKLFQMFKKVLLLGYGQKSADGREFEKSEELSRKFSQTKAYDALIIEFFDNPEYAAEFIGKMLPQGLDAKVKEMQAKQGNRQLVAPAN